jgi:hypothetical protein
MLSPTSGDGAILTSTPESSQIRQEMTTVRQGRIDRVAQVEGIGSTPGRLRVFFLLLASKPRY